jgi:O-antigen/teichoic acid export membrane protein
MIQQKLRALVASGDSRFLEVVKHSTFALGVLILTTIIQFVFDIVLTRTFGAHDAGVFYLCFSVLMITALIGRLGMERAIVQFMPPLLHKKPGEAAGITTTATRLSLLLTVPMALLLFFASPFVAETIFNDTNLVPYLQIFALAIPGLSLSYVYSGTLRALKRTQSSLIVQRTLMYAAGIPIVLLIGISFDLYWAMVGFVCAIYASAILAYVLIRKHHPPYERSIPFSTKRMLATSLPLLFVVFALQMNGQASVLLLGAYGSTGDVAIFNIALKISLLMGLILTAVNAIAGTTISELYSSKNHSQLRTMVSKLSALGTVAGLPLFIVLASLPAVWLGLFGDEFTTGTTALVILLIGQLVSVSVGSTDYALAMTGHERALAVAVGISLVVNLLLGIILIPLMGIDGAAIATAVTIILSNLIMVLMVRHYIGAWLLPFRYMGIWLGTLFKSKETNA